MQTRIKFCGLTRIQDVQYAINLGVDALGFVFVKNSARNVDIATAVNLTREVPPFIIKVGLFMNAQAEDVRQVMKHVKFNLLQFHGEEDEAFCKQFNTPYIKAVPMGSTSSVVEFCDSYKTATGFILDSHASGQMGGSGEKFAWEDIPKDLNKPIILAGGLTANNVAEAIRVVQPYAVDVSSGIEAGKGIKDPAKMEQFIKEVRRD
ncbi:MAG: phosphoribosylanthranilate isomerase [Gammaproteobacteria bacterium]